MKAFLRACCCPVFAEVIRPRVVALTVAAIGGAQVFCSMHGFGMPCMFQRTTGLPCPGCGLTRSVMALVHGQMGTSLKWHPLGPVLFVGLSVALIAAVLPAKARERMIAAIAAFEARTGIVAFMTVVFMMIWVLRLFQVTPMFSIRGPQ